MWKAPPVLIVSPGATESSQIANLARRCKLRPVHAPTLADALRLLDEVQPLIIFCSDEICDCTMRQAIRALRKHAKVPVVALSRLAEWTHCVEACSAGAFDYIACPPDPREGRRVLRMALHQFRSDHPRTNAAHAA